MDPDEKEVGQLDRSWAGFELILNARVTVTEHATDLQRETGREVCTPLAPQTLGSMNDETCDIVLLARL
jgi:hypothetical protein